LTPLRRTGSHAGAMAQVAAIAGMVGATILMLGVIWALDRL
jgi:hypothetical protein